MKEYRTRLSSFVSSLHLLKGDPHTFIHVPTSMCTVSLRNLSVSSEMRTLTWRYAVYHLVELSVSHAHSHTHSQSLISLSCALGLGLRLPFPCLRTRLAVRLQTLYSTDITAGHDASSDPVGIYMIHSEVCEKCPPPLPFASDYSRSGISNNLAEVPRKS